MLFNSLLDLAGMKYVEEKDTLLIMTGREYFKNTAKDAHNI